MGIDEAVRQDGSESYVSRGAYGLSSMADALVMQRLERRSNNLEGEVKRLEGRIKELETDLAALIERVRETVGLGG
jgi:predicted RNase H-like nuclease (RuvC/YqgF family)